MMRKFALATLIIPLAIGCKNDAFEDDTSIDCSATGPELALLSNTNTSCGQSIGNIMVNATGGEGSLDFSIDGTTFQATGDFSGLAAGTYTVSVKDENSCTDELDVTVGNDDGVNITLESDDAGCNTNNGEIRVKGTGGSKPYQYKLEASGTYQNDSVFKNLSAGTHQIFVQDNDGCETNQSAILTSGVQFSEVKTIVSTNCALSGCHNGSISPNLSIDANIKASSSRIKARTGAGTMPPSGPLSTQQVNAIACWVDDGASL